jgi:predicted SprT family Zn-dependent metalloprotease
MKNQNLEKLYQLFDELNLKYFDNILPPIELKFSNRLKTTGGQYFREPKKVIQISTRYFEHGNPWDEIRDTLGHEMIHYWLDYQNKPCGHTKEFYQKLDECGFERYSRLGPARAKYHYKCPECHRSFYRIKKGTLSCGHCSGKKYNPKFKLYLYEVLNPKTKNKNKTKNSPLKTKNIIKQLFLPFIK